MTRTERKTYCELIWDFIFGYGDFAIEMLLLFGNDDYSYPGDYDRYYNSTVNTGVSFSQMDGHLAVWHVGSSLGLWSADRGDVNYYLTEAGKLFQKIVRSNPGLHARYQQLESFWDTCYPLDVKNKPRPVELLFAPGWLDWLEAKLYAPVQLIGRPEVFLLYSVSEKEIVINRIESPTDIVFKPDGLRSITRHPQTGMLVFDVAKEAINPELKERESYYYRLSCLTFT